LFFAILPLSIIKKPIGGVTMSVGTIVFISVLLILGSWCIIYFTFRLWPILVNFLIGTTALAYILEEGQSGWWISLPIIWYVASIIPIVLLIYVAVKIDLEEQNNIRNWD